MKNLYKVGSRVYHDGHGRGTVIEVRQPDRSDHLDYLMSDRGRELLPSVASIALDSFYSPTRYPYVVRYDRTGYTDVYSIGDLSRRNQ